MASWPTARPRVSSRDRGGAIALRIVIAILVCCCWLSPARAQGIFTFPAAAPAVPKSPIAIEHAKDKQKQMLVQAEEINYDYTNHRVSAVGNVQIYYGGSTLEANKVIYDQTSKRLHAEGNARLTEPDGKVTLGETMDLSDDYRDGFVDSLRLDTPDQTRMAATSADRSGGNFTVLHNGVYTACEPCKDDPTKPPLWQVKAARIIHDQGEKMIYFEDARIEFFGKPLAYFPYLSTPDPTVTRKTGVLIPTTGYSSILGAYADIPYYWAVAPDRDVTFSPTLMSSQGVMPQFEYRQRLLDGAYTIRGAGLYQLDKGAFGEGAPGYRDFRGGVESSGQFAINDKWVWGWDTVALTDKQFLTDYHPSLMNYRTSVADPLAPNISQGVSQLYLSGAGNRSYFDARSIAYEGLSPADSQTQLPVVHPVIDYNYTFDHPIIGGELSYKLNFTSITRNSADFEPITATALANNTCMQTADSMVQMPSNCLLRGVPGTYSRFSAETDWRRSFTDSYGQVFTPFASMRVDAASMQITNQPSVSNYISTDDSDVVRAMPTVGLEYRYPFINVQSWGTQTIEPIGQVIARPNETKIGALPNEDAQSLIFDDTNLFRVDKFSGWDRAEGGGRANAGVQYTAQFNQAGTVKALFGQSYQLFGVNSYAVPSLTNTGIESGLDTTRSDYVAGASYQPNNIYTFSSRFRFDHDTFDMQRMELETRANFDRWNVSVLYGDYAPQPDIGFLYRRQGILGTGTVKLDSNWVLTGGARYDLFAHAFNQTQIGLGYVDDCMILGLNYITGYTYDNATGTPTLNHQIMLQLTLRTLGGTTVSQSVSGL
jgi:LPS-assembly protein